MRNLLLLVALCGCDSSPPIDSQGQYNFAVRADRDKWQARDLKFQSVVGPYAIYQVTGSHPQLIGPYVKAHHGFSTLSASSSYFTADNRAHQSVMLLFGGKGGDLPLVALHSDPALQGCAAPEEAVMDLPCDDNSTTGATGGTTGGSTGGTGETGGSTGGTTGDTASTTGGVPIGTTGSTGGNPVGDTTSGGTTGGVDVVGGSTGGSQVDQPQGGDGAEPADNGATGDVHHMIVEMKNVPPPGSLVLLRRVGITRARLQGASAPGLCCHAGQCEVQ